MPKETTDIISANTFGLEYQDLLLIYFCEEVEFTAKYEETKGHSFIADPIGSKDNLIQQFNQYKRYAFRNFMGKNQDS